MKTKVSFYCLCFSWIFLIYLVFYIHGVIISPTPSQITSTNFIIPISSSIYSVLYPADPCVNGTDDCTPSLADCKSANSSVNYSCICLAGLHGNGTGYGGCQDINECLNKSNVCFPHSTCNNTYRSYECVCDNGYIYNGSACVESKFAPYQKCEFMKNEDTKSGVKLEIQEGVPIGGINQTNFYICINGFISVREDLCANGPSGNLGDPIQPGIILAPYLANISHGSSERHSSDSVIYYCAYSSNNELVSQGDTVNAHINIANYIRTRTNLTNFMPRNSIVATWFKVSPANSAVNVSFNHTERATFQAVISTDGENTFLYYVYFNMSWIGEHEVQVGYRYNPSISIVPQPPHFYERLRFDKAHFLQPNGNLEEGTISFRVSYSNDTRMERNCKIFYNAHPTLRELNDLFQIDTSLNSTRSREIAINQRLAACPSTITQALADDRFAAQNPNLRNIIEKCHGAGQITTTNSTLCTGLPNFCVHSRIFSKLTTSFNYDFIIYTRCCYISEFGALIKSFTPGDMSSSHNIIFRDPYSNGSVPSPNYLTFYESVEKDCCLYSSLCHLFGEMILITNSDAYTPPSISTLFGDPHFVTFDGFLYTFNGLGDYWLFKTLTVNYAVQIQARTCIAPINGTTSSSTPQATVICGFAFTENGQATFELYLEIETGVTTFYIDGNPFKLVDFPKSFVFGSTLIIYSDDSPREIKFILPSGITFSIAIHLRMLQAIVSVTTQFAGRTAGLLGYYNDDIYDDLVSANGTLISTNASERVIYDDFGESWRVSGIDSLFSKQPPIQETQYEPYFSEDLTRLLASDRALKNQAKEVCGGDFVTNKNCYYDFIVTRDKNLAVEGKKFLKRSNDIISAINRTPPFISGPSTLNVTRFSPINFTIEVTQSLRNLTFFIITNFSSYHLENAKTGIVSFTPQYNNETVKLGVIDEYGNAALLQPRNIICDCLNDGFCSSHASSSGTYYNVILSCSCPPNFSGSRCETKIGWLRSKFNFTMTGKTNSIAQIEHELSESLKSTFVSLDPSDLFLSVVGFRNRSGVYDFQVHVFMRNNSKESRLKFCRHMRNFSSVYLQSINETVDIDVLRHECCFKETFEEANFKGEYTFETSVINYSVTLNCKFNPNETLIRSCTLNEDGDASWAAPDLKNCDPKTETTKNLIKLNQANICAVHTDRNCTTVVEMAHNLTEAVTNGTDISNSRDVEYVSNIVGNIIKIANVNETVQVKQDVINTVSNILDSNTSVIELAENNSRAASRYLANLDDLAVKIGNSLTNVGDNIKESSKNIGFQVSKVPLEDLQIVADLSKANDSIIITNDYIIAPTFQASALLRNSTFNDSGTVVFAYAYRQSKFFVVDKNEAPDQLGDVVDSMVLTLSVGDKEISHLPEPVILKFKRRNVLEAISNKEINNSCNFWEKSGRWSTRNCTLVNVTGNIVTCSCGHLTSFALLFNIYDSDYNPFALQIVSSIGSGISLVGLALTFIFHLFIGKMRKTLHSKILICLSFTLMMVLILLLSALPKTKNTSTVGCQIIAAFMHYFMLSSFMWMLFTAINLLQKISFSMSTRGRSDTKFFVVSSILAWGIPFIITLVTGVASPESLGDKKICFVTGKDAFRYGVVLPVTLIIMINFGSLFAIIVTLVKRKSIAVSTTDHWKNLRIAFMCTMLFGLTWVFGFLAIGDAAKVFIWLFCIFSSLQGFFIFVFYTLRDSKFQAFFKGWKCCPTGVSFVINHMSYRLTRATRSDTYAMRHSEVPSSSGYVRSQVNR